MADQAAVETAIAAMVANALYPQGTAAPSVTGDLIRIYRGYPAAPALDADLAAGALHVSVAAAGVVKNVTRYPRIWQAVTPVSATLSVAVSGQSVSFAGVCAAGQLAGVIVNGSVFPYAVQGNDTPSTVASNLSAALREAGWLVGYAGAMLSVPGADRLSARVVNGAGALQEIKRQLQDFKISLWCPDPRSRDAVAALIDEAMADLKFMPLSDGSSARVIFAGSETVDMSADATLYRRDLVYSAEYPTTLAQTEPAMLFGTGNFEADGAFVAAIQG